MDKRTLKGILAVGSTLLVPAVPAEGAKHSAPTAHHTTADVHERPVTRQEAVKSMLAMSSGISNLAQSLQSGDISASRTNASRTTAAVAGIITLGDHKKQTSGEASEQAFVPVTSEMQVEVLRASKLAGEIEADAERIKGESGAYVNETDRALMRGAARAAADAIDTVRGVIEDALSAARHSSPIVHDEPAPKPAHTTHVFRGGAGPTHYRVREQDPLPNSHQFRGATGPAVQYDQPYGEYVVPSYQGSVIIAEPSTVIIQGGRTFRGGDWGERVEGERSEAHRGAPRRR